MWQLAEAKNKFSQVFTRAMTEGPQTITRRGEEAVLISRAEYERLAGKPRPKMTLGEYLLSGPSFEGVDLTRDRSPMREVNFEFDDE
ncbi:type II toxin-antitoxin system Phd/YefM family antitoxin [Amaricoccus sp.]|uniref:type II toxin-antitoxin system Phd/YefM family antitoxin n=1 Tax=Amaricoccus sp. TaxID=1872485 RepID=UPI001B6E33F8|nr:type II toxin-antitoxin system Phd/YefM family antitoxin [Amaricoccus sp.]MBP7001248.1 type II toxin-antitoxin system Phd/YefM family antitoxin [Amaricoccus sp.]